MNNKLPYCVYLIQNKINNKKIIIPISLQKLVDQENKSRQKNPKEKTRNEGL